MTWNAIAVIAALTILSTFLLLRPLRRLLELLSEGIETLIGQALEALDSVTHHLIALRHRHFGGSFLPLVGSVPLVAIAAMLLLADFRVTVATLQSLLPVEPEEWHVGVAGYTFGLAESSAVGLVGLHVIAGFLLLEAAKITRFLPLDQLMSARGLRALRWGALAGLVLLAALSAALAAWRTDQLLTVTAMEDLTSIAAVDRAAPFSPGPPRPSLENLPQLLMPLLAFIVPIGGAVATGGAYFATLAVLNTVAGALSLLVSTTRALLVLTRHVIVVLVRLLVSLLELAVAPLTESGRYLALLWTILSTRPDRHHD
jgi:hypothetical protein